ncbi:MAG TPA: PHP domain-containing protein [Gemmatimonadales bacterium]|nr:PHP domain-containing protein [Gemmatimonadales bacterium]
MRRWRLPTAIGAAVLLARILDAPPLLDVALSAPPADISIEYPVLHVLLAPLTVPADWLNGGSRYDLFSLIGWVAFAVVAWSALAVPRAGAGSWRVAASRLIAGCLALVAFVAVVVWAWRPVPRIVVADSTALVFDVHSHTSLSHDGRAGFGVAANAAWHRRTGFHAAFVTDHNRYGAVRQWQADRPEDAVRLLNGEELSLAGLHLIVLGTRRELSSAPHNESAAATLGLVDSLASDPERPLLVASLPEYARHWWGQRLDTLLMSGIGGLEIWTSSPKGMEFSAADRARALTAARLRRLAVVGATDMHGLGQTATVWNVVRIPDWRSLSDSTLERTLLAHLRAGGAEGNRVIALDRWQAAGGAWAWAAAPLGLWGALRRTSPAHTLVMLLWLLIPVGLAGLRRSG